MFTALAPEQQVAVMNSIAEVSAAAAVAYMEHMPACSDLLTEWYERERRKLIGRARVEFSSLAAL